MAVTVFSLLQKGHVNCLASFGCTFLGGGLEDLRLPWSVGRCEQCRRVKPGQRLTHHSRSLCLRLARTLQHLPRVCSRRCATSCRGGPRASCCVLFGQNFGGDCQCRTTLRARRRACGPPVVAMAGGLNAHTNPFVEAWGMKREHIEKTFRWTPKSLGIIAITGVVLPVLAYKIAVAEFVRASARQTQHGTTRLSDPLTRAQDKGNKRQGKPKQAFM